MTPADAIDLLKGAGLTEAAIAAKVQVRQSTINKIRHGLMSPSYALGKALVDWAETVSANGLDDLPSAA
jgi:transcriptional regulator with XRE-family HTH domain